jgi:hypothetical protein
MRHTVRADARRALRYGPQLVAHAYLDPEAAAVTTAHPRAFLACAGRYGRPCTQCAPADPPG